MIRRDSLNQKRLAFTLVALMIFVPGSAMLTSDINFDEDETPYYSNGIWGAGGSNDTVGLTLLQAVQIQRMELMHMVT